MTWNECEGCLRTALAEAGAPQRTVDWIIEDFQPRFLAIQGEWSEEVPIACKEAISRVVETLTGAIHAAIGQILELEIALYYAKFPGGNPTGGLRASPILRLVA